MSVFGKDVDFGMLDEKGRKIGARVRLYTRDEEVEVLVHATRDGLTFGAVPRSRCVADIEQANTEVQRRLTSMAKRYAKKLNLLAEGCHAKWVCPDTGVILTLRDMDDDDPQAGPYMVVCEEHGSCVGVATKALGRSSTGLDFCDDCRESQE
jgi:hypothetical protein